LLAIVPPVDRGPVDVQVPGHSRDGPVARGDAGRVSDGFEESLAECHLQPSMPV
jgi:hypothetical protein